MCKGSRRDALESPDLGKRAPLAFSKSGDSSRLRSLRQEGIDHQWDQHLHPKWQLAPDWRCGPHLAAIGVQVEHIHADGHLESHGAALSRLARIFNLPEYDLFHSREEILADAYRRQEERIAHEVAAESTDGTTITGAA